MDGYRGAEFGFETNFDAKPNSYTTVTVCTPTADEYRGRAGAVFPMTSTIAGIVAFNDLVSIKRMHGGRGHNHPLNNTGEINATPMSVSGFNLTLKRLTEGKIDQRVGKYKITKDFNQSGKPEENRRMLLDILGVNNDYEDMYKSSVDDEVDDENKFSLKRLVNEFSLLGVSVSVNHALSGPDGNNGVDFVTSGDVMTKDYWSHILARVNTTKVGPDYYGKKVLKEEGVYMDMRTYTPTIYMGDHLGFALKIKTKEEIVAELFPVAYRNSNQNLTEYNALIKKTKEYFEIVPAIKRANGYLTCREGTHFFELGKCVEQKPAMFSSVAIHNNAAAEYATSSFVKVLVSQTHNI